MPNGLKKNQQAFTIIEVLIVLTIVGLIMLIVFLAVPALQRNSRNTQRKHDVASLLAAVSEYTGNHDGNLPGNTCQQFNDPAAFSETSPKLGYYDPAHVQWCLNPSPVSGNNTEDLDNVIVVNYAKCDPNGNYVSTGASKRTTIALFSIETANGTPYPQCKES